MRRSRERGPDWVFQVGKDLRQEIAAKLPDRTGEDCRKYIEEPRNPWTSLCYDHIP